MIFTRAILMGVLAFQCLAQTPKALFRDVTSQVTLQVSTPRPSGGTTRPRTQPVTVNAVTGLKYWIELLTPEKQLLRVNANRQFKSGERIRFHVESNVDGALTMMQSQDDGALEMLFPGRTGADNRIRRFQEKVFPSETGFFRFDSRTGNIRLLLLVQAGGALEMSLASTRPPASSQEAPPKPAPDPRIRGGEPPMTEKEFLAEIARSKGSKRLEIDDSPAEAATYVVVDARKDPDVKPGVIAVEVQLLQTGN